MKRGRTGGDQNSLEKSNIPGSASLFEGIRRGDYAALARAITLIESRNPAHREQAQELLNRCLPHTQKAIRIGITGPPGVGKSTFIDALGTLITASHKSVAVLAVDPSSAVSKGSILGDKTRMQKLAVDPRAFIRPSPSAENPGGVARATREALILCEAAGFDIVLIETVGVGQGEITVHSMVDFFLLLQSGGGGDELQGIKRGIVEMADAIIINKADGPMRSLAEEAKAAFERAIALYPPKENGWEVPVLMCSSVEGTGLTEIWELLHAYHTKFSESGYLEKKRKAQNMFWFEQSVEAELWRQFLSHKAVATEKERLSQLVLDNRISPFQAAGLLVSAYLGSVK